MTNTLAKNKTAGVGKYSYQYVDIAQIHDYLETINAKYIQQIKRIDNDDYVMTKRCFNDEWENEWLQGCKVVDATLVGVKNPAQEQGSALTYARRYSLLMAFGLATEDNDAQELTQTIEVTEDYARQYVFEFGKHKGNRLVDVIESDNGYIQWLLKNESTAPDLLKSIEILTGEKPKEIDLDKTKRLMEIIVQKELDTDKILDYYKVDSLNDLTNEQIDEIVLKRG